MLVEIIPLPLLSIRVCFQLHITTGEHDNVHLMSVSVENTCKAVWYLINGPTLSEEMEILTEFYKSVKTRQINNFVSIETELN